MTDDLTLPDAASRAAWADYLDLEQMGALADKEAKLEVFLALMRAGGPAARREFVDSWGRLYLDGRVRCPMPVGSGAWVRSKLFRGIFAPVLNEGHCSGAPNYARWSAQMLVSVREAEGDQRPPRDALYREAMKLDPDDERARLLFAHSILVDVDRSLLGLPSSGLPTTPPSVRQDADDLAELLTATPWQREASRGRAALNRLADCQRSDGVMRAARKFLKVRWEILASLGLSV